MTRHEIQVLRAAGIPEHVVAWRTAVSVRSVDRIRQEPPVTGPIRTVRVRPAGSDPVSYTHLTLPTIYSV